MSDTTTTSTTSGASTNANSSYTELWDKLSGSTTENNAQGNLHIHVEKSNDSTTEENEMDGNLFQAFNAGMSAAANNAKTNNGISPAEMMMFANNGNGFGGNGAWNNPFMYLIWLAIFGGGFGGNGLFGGNANAANQALRTADNEANTALLLQAINSGNNVSQRDIDKIANAINVDSAQVTNAINSIHGAINQVGNANNLNTRDVIISAMQGNQAILTQLQNACAQSQLNCCNINNSISQQSLQLTNTLNTGFSQLGYQNQSNTTAIISAIEANRIADLQSENSRLLAENISAKQEANAAANQSQTTLLLSQILAKLNTSTTTPTS